VIISSEVGWRKPAPEFFDVVCRRTNCRPEEILFVGDDLINDIHGAVQSGMPATWIDRRGDAHGGKSESGDENGQTVSARRIRALTELISHVP
jgi:FMN phosphatase YigB (HAD superfamily)